jgi:hypothetical protein
MRGHLDDVDVQSVLGGGSHSKSLAPPAGDCDQLVMKLAVQ